MESLREGISYELLSSTAAKANISVVRVKLTDTALKAIEEFNDKFRKLKIILPPKTVVVKALQIIGRCVNLKDRSYIPNIQFKGNQGFIQVPVIGSSSYRTFSFSLTKIDVRKPGVEECIHYSAKIGGPTLSSVGIISHTLRVQATEDVYQATVEKMSIAEEENKKFRTQAIDQSGPNIGRKVKKVSSLKANVAPTVIQSKTPQIPTKPADLLRQHTARLSEPGPRQGPSIHSKNRKSDGCQVAGRIASVDSLSVRDRVVHLLALRAYKKPELILRLQRDGCRPDVSSLCSILDEVAQCARDTYTLHRHICATDVRPDWPLYTDEDRLALSRKLKKLDELPVTQSPALSPCPSVDSRGSPRPPSSQKRVSSTTDVEFTMANSKRLRVAHAVNKSNIDTPTSKLNTPIASTRDAKEVENSNADDFISMYKPICSAADRRQYKRDFCKEYAEYLDLHKKTEQRMLIFNELSKSLKQHLDGSAEYECANVPTLVNVEAGFDEAEALKIKQLIYAEYVKLKKDSQYSDDRRRCDYLHRKLGHIKRVVNDYDSMQLSVDSSSAT